MPPAPWAPTSRADPFGPVAALTLEGQPFRFRWIPPGQFRMGSPPTEFGREPDEDPHPIHLTEGFYLSETPITQAQWTALTGHNPSSFQRGGPWPVEQVSWFDCVQFCAAFQSRVPGIRARLPSEAEWEYACRAGTPGPYWDPTRPLDDLAWYNENAGGQTHPVAQKLPNPWGLFDMLGNVSEWCADPYTLHPAQNTPRVHRGGSFDDPALWLRAACRNYEDPHDRCLVRGLRLALGPATPAEGCP